MIQPFLCAKLTASWQQNFVCLPESCDRKEFYYDDWALVPIDEKIEC